MANRASQLRKSFKAPLTPGYSVYSMEMGQPSPAFSMTPLTNGKTSSSPTVKEDFGKNDNNGLRQLQMLHWTRVALSVLVVGAAAAIVGCEGHALHTHNTTRLPAEFFLPLWPQNLDLRPTVAILAGGTVIMALGLFYLLVAILPSCSRRYFFHNLLFLIVSFLGITASAVVTGYSAHIYSKSSRDTIESWTCRWDKGASSSALAQATGSKSAATSPAISAPSGFGRLCWESHAAFDITVVMLFLEVVALGLGSVSFWMERKM